MTSTDDPALQNIVARLESISEEIADKAIGVLFAAQRAGGGKRPDEERTLTQARRAVEKAIHLLSRSD